MWSYKWHILSLVAPHMNETEAKYEKGMSMFRGCGMQLKEDIGLLQFNSETIEHWGTYIVWELGKFLTIIYPILLPNVLDRLWCHSAYARTWPIKGADYLTKEKRFGDAFQGKERKGMFGNHQGDRNGLVKGTFSEKMGSYLHKFSL